MNALKREIATNIAHDGPITLEHYMGLCLGHPHHGYYMTREPFGVAGDFVTAPEISQMFGELIGVWLAEAWRAAGGPTPANLIELGPGRGTLMSDILRVARVSPDFLDAVHPCLVEMSPRLRDIQHRTLANAARQVSWSDSFATTPSGPAFIVANEFFDALPVRHYVKTLAGWRQRLIGLDQTGTLAFGLSEKVEPTLTAPAREGSIIEVCPAGQRLMSDIARRLVAEGGVLLLIDSDTQGPAEVLAATLRDNAKAMLVGAPTAGAAVEFTDFPLGGGRSVRVAVSQASTPKSGGLFTKGVSPDIVVRLDRETRDKIFDQAGKEGVGRFAFDVDPPRLNEAALVANTNPEIGEESRDKAGPTLRDTVLQRALDLVTAIGFFKK